MKRPIRKAAVTEEKEGVVIDPERDCNRKCQGMLSVMGLTIADVRLGALAVFTGSGAMAQDTAATAPTEVAGAIAPVLKVDTRDRAWVLTSTALVLAMTRLGCVLLRQNGPEQSYLGHGHSKHRHALPGPPDLDSCRV